MPWGEPVSGNTNAAAVGSDRDLSLLIMNAWHDDAAVPEVCLTGGDLARTLGVDGDTTDRLNTRAVGTRAVCDVGVARFHGASGNVALPFVAHAVVRSLLWGSGWAVMNAAWRGRWNVAPKAHPGDGKLDVVRWDLAWRQRWSARKRLPLGAHVPHPGIRIVRTAATTITVPTGSGLWLDGARVETSGEIDIAVTPQAVSVVF